MAFWTLDLTDLIQISEGVWLTFAQNGDWELITNGQSLYSRTKNGIGCGRVHLTVSSDLDIITGVNKEDATDRELLNMMLLERIAEEIGL